MSKRTGQSRKLGPAAKRHLHLVLDLGSLTPEPEPHGVRSTLAAAIPVAELSHPEHPNTPKGGVVG